MRIFLTGATGFVGRALLLAFRDAGHQVTALVRAPSRAPGVAAASATPLVGELARPEGYLPAAAASDAVVHAAFEYAPDGSENRALDEQVAVALLGAAAGPFVYTSNAYLLRTAGGEPVDETIDPARFATTGGAWRLELERRIVAASPAAAVVRLGFVYGGKGGTLPDLFAAALRHGRLAYPGTGRARGSYIHCRDLAALYRTILERGAGGIFHATDGRPMPAVDLLRVVCRTAGVSHDVRPLEPADAGLGMDAHTLDILDRDVAVLSSRSQALGWRPEYADLSAGAAAAYAELQAEA